MNRLDRSCEWDYEFLFVCFCRPDALYQPEDLSDYSSNGDVMLDTCTSERQPENMWANRKKVNIGTNISQIL